MYIILYINTDGLLTLEEWAEGFGALAESVYICVCIYISIYI